MNDLLKSIELNTIEHIKLLLAHPRVDPAAQDNDAIQAASYMGHKEVVELLKARGCVL